MNRKNYVCFEHRAHGRSGWYTKDMGSIHCPVDGEPMINVGYKERIPKKGDDKGWNRLEDLMIKTT